ncbi:MAG TPA: FixH family protein [Candidatus Paceibacterota bacterium]|nr:FixH family protein [Candidatus Paceibacterota bacterium]
MKKQRNFWPLGITLGALLCIGCYATFVIIACTHKSELVSDNYYDQEIKYQTRIDSQTRTARLATRATATYDDVAKSILVSLPAEHVGKSAGGEIVLFRPSEAGQDRTFKFAPDAVGTQVLDVADVPQGLYRLRFSWNVSGEDYFLDQKIIIGPAELQAKFAAMMKPHTATSAPN